MMFHVRYDVDGEGPMWRLVALDVWAWVWGDVDRACGS